MFKMTWVLGMKATFSVVGRISDVGVVRSADTLIGNHREKRTQRSGVWLLVALEAMGLVGSVGRLEDCCFAFRFLFF